MQFSNIVAKAEQGVVFAAFGKSAGLSNITLSNISLTVAAISDIPHNVSWQVPDSRAVHDYRPVLLSRSLTRTHARIRACMRTHTFMHMHIHILSLALALALSLAHALSLCSLLADVHASVWLACFILGAQPHLVTHLGRCLDPQLHERRQNSRVLL